MSSDSTAVALLSSAQAMTALSMGDRLGIANFWSIV